jgi:hypothetical protein
MPLNNVKIRSYYIEFEPEESEIATGTKQFAAADPSLSFQTFQGDSLGLCGGRPSNHVSYGFSMLYKLQCAGLWLKR